MRRPEQTRNMSRRHTWQRRKGSRWGCERRNEHHTRRRERLFGLTRSTCAIRRGPWRDILRKGMFGGRHGGVKVYISCFVTPGPDSTFTLFPLSLSPPSTPPFFRNPPPMGDWGPGCSRLYRLLLSLADGREMPPTKGKALMTKHASQRPVVPRPRRAYLDPGRWGWGMGTYVYS